MEIKAQFKKALPTIERSGFKSQKIWVTYSENPEYPQTIEFELNKDKCDTLNNVAPGTELTVHFNLRGREWTKPETQVTSVFNSLVAWKVDVAGGQVAVEPAPFAATAPPVTEEKLPF